MMYSVPETFQDPESLSVSTGGDKYEIASACSVNISLPPPSFLHTPHTHNPHPFPQSRNAYDKYSSQYFSTGRPQPPMIHPSSLSVSHNSIPAVINPVSSPEPSTSQSSISTNTNPIGLETLQNQLINFRLNNAKKNMSTSRKNRIISFSFSKFFRLNNI